MAKHPLVQDFFDEATNTFSYVVSDPITKRCAIIDSVLDYDAASATTSTTQADRIIAYVKAQGLTVEWILETHVHADHLTAAQYLKVFETGTGRKNCNQPENRCGAADLCCNL